MGFFTDYQDLKGSHGLSGNVTNAPEASNKSHLQPSGIVQGTWTYAPTSRLLLEAGAGWMIWHYAAELQPEVSLDDISIVEQSTNRRYNAPSNFLGAGGDVWVVDRYTERASLSYVTGTHNFKAGIQVEQGVIKEGTRRKTGPFGDIEYRYRNGVPNRITLSAHPFADSARMSPDLGLYVQDQWTVTDRATLNLGLRFDYWNGYIPEQTLAANRFLPERHFDRVDKVPQLKDINPRLGLSYDLFGTGQTALKVSLGRYSDLTGLFYTQVADPARTSIRSATRSWNDVNENFIPDCELANFVANGECGPISNKNFGKLNPNLIRFADEVMQGWDARKYTWDIATEVQHELAPGLSVTGGYYHNWDGNIRTRVNEAVTPADFDPYCITTPVDPGLPDGGGQQVCGLYNISQEKFGDFDQVWRQSRNFREGSTRVSNFVTATMDARLASGIRIGGGVDTGRTVWDNCFVTDNPQFATIVHITGGIGSREVDQRFCHEKQGLLPNLQVKFHGSVPLPGDVMMSATYVNVAGQQILADFPATSAAIAPSLGRPLSGGARTATIQLIEPYTQYEGRRAMLDLRVSKIFNLGSGGRLNANVDLYNIFNANTIMARRDRYGPSLGQPTRLLPGRMLQFGARLTF